MHFNLVLIIVTNTKHAFVLTRVFKPGAEVDFPHGILREENFPLAPEATRKTHTLIFTTISNFQSYLLLIHSSLYSCNKPFASILIWKFEDKSPSWLSENSQVYGEKDK